MSLNFPKKFSPNNWAKSRKFGDQNPVNLQCAVWWLVALHFGFRAQDESHCLLQSFSWAKQHVCCKSYMWMILRVRFVCVSKPLNWSAITTKYHRNNSSFFKICYIYTKGRNLTFKIVYSIYRLGRSSKNKENQHNKSDNHIQRLWYAIDIYHIIQRWHS